MKTTTGTFETEHANKYMKQLCKHFGHKVKAEVDGDKGRVEFVFGVAEMESSDAMLTVVMHLEEEVDPALAHNVIDSHLVTFAYREQFKTMAWQ